ncbi:MAG: DUF4249 family protein [Bacteroidales bacterium]|nr:DUF4249 family protein [Bacteroidales bacterium]
MLNRLVFFGMTLWAACMLTSCEEPVTIDLPQHTNSAVIEGWIENGRTATVAMSISRPYYSYTSHDSLMASIQTQAKIVVTDSNTGESEQLSLDYTEDHIFGLARMAYVGKKLKGVPGHTYLLHIENKGKVYDASTRIPSHGPQVDSVYFSRSGRSFLRIRFTDPKGEFNCYRFLTKVMDEDMSYGQVYLGTFDDLTFDGQQLNFELVRMPLSNLFSLEYKTLEDIKNATMFKKGNVVCVKSTLTDPMTKSFWFALQVDLSMANNLLVTPGVYPTNIRESEGAHVSGIWSGYYARYDTIVCR